MVIEPSWTGQEGIRYTKGINLNHMDKIPSQPTREEIMPNVKAAVETAEEKRTRESVQDYFKDINKSYTENNNFGTEWGSWRNRESKTMALDRIRRAGNKTKLILDGRSELKYLLDSIDSLGLLASGYWGALEGEKNNFEDIDEKVRNEIKATGKRNKEIFLKFCDKVFPENARPDSRESTMYLVQNLSQQWEQIDASVSHELRDIFLKTKDVRQLEALIDRSSRTMSEDLAFSLDSSLCYSEDQDGIYAGDNAETRGEQEKKFLDKARLVHQLALIKEKLGEGFQNSTGHEEAKSGEQPKADLNGLAEYYQFLAEKADTEAEGTQNVSEKKRIVERGKKFEAVDSWIRAGVRQGAQTKEALVEYLQQQEDELWKKVDIASVDDVKRIGGTVDDIRRTRQFVDQYDESTLKHAGFRAWQKKKIEPENTESATREKLKEDIDAVLNEAIDQEQKRVDAAAEKTRATGVKTQFIRDYAPYIKQLKAEYPDSYHEQILKAMEAISAKKHEFTELHKDDKGYNELFAQRDARDKVYNETEIKHALDLAKSNYDKEVLAQPGMKMTGSSPKNFLRYLYHDFQNKGLI